MPGAICLKGRSPLTIKWRNRNVNGSPSKLAQRRSNQSVSHSLTTSLRSVFSQWAQWVCNSTQSVRPSVRPSARRTTSQSVNQSVRQPVRQSISRPTNQRDNAPAPDMPDHNTNRQTKTRPTKQRQTQRRRPRNYDAIITLTPTDQLYLKSAMQVQEKESHHA